MLDRLKPRPGSHRPRRRRGRGEGSGLGKTSGRGTKGAGARAGSKARYHREGGNMPLAQRLPKFGFHNKWSTIYQVVNVGQLGALEADTVIDAGLLHRAGLVPRGDRPVKLLGDGSLDRGLRIRVAAASRTAQEKVRAAGGELELGVKPTGREPRS